MQRLRRSRRVWPIALLAVLAVASPAARAEYADSYELWPQLNAFVSLSPRTRLYLDASYARGVESDAGSLDGSAFVDVSLKPLLRKELQSGDWQRSRYIWMRAGYTRISKVSAGTFDVAEDRASVALYGKLPLPAGVLLEGRVRTDLRWIGGDYSTRYRFRAEASREYAVAGRPVAPYFNVEWFYDTRYDRWSRTACNLGVEVTEGRHFRYELYTALQADHEPDDERVGAFGIVLKWYW